MRKILAFLLCLVTSAWAQPGSFSAACARAQREHRPVLLLQLFGRLDEEYC